MKVFNDDELANFYLNAEYSRYIKNEKVFFFNEKTNKITSVPVDRANQFLEKFSWFHIVRNIFPNPRYERSLRMNREDKTLENEFIIKYEEALI